MRKGAFLLQFCGSQFSCKAIVVAWLAARLRGVSSSSLHGESDEMQFKIIFSTIGCVIWGHEKWFKQVIVIYLRNILWFYLDASALQQNEISTNEKPIELSKDKCSIISSRCLKMYGIAEVVVNAKGGSWYFSHVREWMRGSLAGDAKKNEDVPRLSGVDIRHVYRLHMRQENLCLLLEWGPNLSVRYAECAWHRSASFEIKCLSEQWTIVCSKTHVHVPNEIFCQAF